MYVYVNETFLINAKGRGHLIVKQQYLNDMWMCLGEMTDSQTHVSALIVMPFSAVLMLSAILIHSRMQSQVVVSNFYKALA